MVGAVHAPIARAPIRHATVVRADTHREPRQLDMLADRQKKDVNFLRNTPIEPAQNQIDIVV
jgi:hypothetical protein